MKGPLFDGAEIFLPERVELNKSCFDCLMFKAMRCGSYFVGRKPTKINSKAIEILKGCSAGNSRKVLIKLKLKAFEPLFKHGELDIKIDGFDGICR